MIKKSELKKTIGLRLKEIRKALSFTQEAMARTLKTGRPNYTRIEIGDTFLNHYFLYKLSSEFNISIDWLICGIGSMFIDSKNNSNPEGKNGHTMDPETEELVEHMEQIPLLHHEVMELFYKFKFENKEIIEAALKNEKVGTDS